MLKSSGANAIGRAVTASLTLIWHCSALIYPKFRAALPNLPRCYINHAAFTRADETRRQRRSDKRAQVNPVHRDTRPAWRRFDDNDDATTT